MLRSVNLFIAISHPELDSGSVHVYLFCFLLALTGFVSSTEWQEKICDEICKNKKPLGISGWEKLRKLIVGKNNIIYVFCFYPLNVLNEFSTFFFNTLWTASISVWIALCSDSSLFNLKSICLSWFSRLSIAFW